MQVLQNMGEPTTGFHLQQSVCAMPWECIAIPSYIVPVLALQDFLERIYNNVKSVLVMY